MKVKGKNGQRTSARATTSTIYDVINNMVVDSQIAPYKTSERELARRNIDEMLNLLGEQKKIIIFDRGYPSLEMIYDLTRLGIKYLFRLAGKTFKKEVEKMLSIDEDIGIVTTASRTRRIKDENKREKIKEQQEMMVRFVKYELPTGEIEVLVTNLEAKEFDSEEIGKLYFKRWKIELAYDIAKNKLNIENFSGQSKIVIEQEFYAQMYLLNVAEDLRRDANRRIKAKKKNGYKYDYQPNMNILIGKLRKRFIVIIMNLSLNKNAEAEKAFDDLMKEIEQNLCPVRPNRKNPRDKYKGYNKYKQNLRRNS